MKNLIKEIKNTGLAVAILISGNGLLFSLGLLF